MNQEASSSIQTLKSSESWKDRQALPSYAKSAWSLEERSALNSSIESLLKCAALDEPKPVESCALSFEEVPRLADGISASLRAIVVRKLLECLGIDESLPFRWDIDHKLVQAIILHEFCPEAIPSSIGLSRVMTDAYGKDLGRTLESIFPESFVIKPVRGAGSDKDVVLKSSDTLLHQDELDRALRHFNGTPISEIYFAQSKIEIISEYRVHSLYKSVIPALVFRNHQRTTLVSATEKEAVIDFVENFLARLPAALTCALCGWDVALTKDNTFKVIEGNYVGKHPIYRSGFQCTAQLQNRNWGPVSTAHLLVYLRRRYGFRMEFNMHSPVRAEIAITADNIARINRWTELLSISDSIHKLWSLSFENEPFGAPSIRRKVFDNEASPMDRRYLEFIDWLHKMTVDLQENS